MRKYLLRVGLAILAAAGTTSCVGGDAGEPITAANAGPILTQFGSVVLGKLPQSNTVPTLPITGATTAAVGPLAAIDCETVNPAVPTDADADGIALTKESTFDCSGTVNGQYTYTRKGTYTIMDKDDAVPGLLGGMRAEFDMTSFKTVNSSDGSTSDGSFQGFWNYQAGANGGVTSTSEFSGRHVYLNQTAGYDVDYVYGYTWAWSNTPENSATPWNAGSVSFKGLFTMNGSFMTENHAGVHSRLSGSFRVNYESRDLVYRSTCTKFYESGSVWMDDSNGTTFEIRYACTTAKLYLNGVESDLYTP